ncbi:DMT family transporter [Streptantibioticus cattleyicolor]|uniref:Integral membrane protein n=1 Tax=Streptantibioticus cattleyicolor (strain ATCC 35852 / DSM 46488 / JCM 4925 / NBRC 14057 / NRRL 8057) TaxID=1003195 RepID=F8JKN0_STREN|nr:DMT family transporter [Streptantibioticus cattleyicolor]AEW98479.1 integral membrane protein [Streptantibioticus cattleyicolor NRRL 8057 = DSM 46488]CCB72464.1 putative integral membrane protein [Streptantibioticus cattleyicolor NRRL 8057 = DSM 46488]
MPQSVSSPGTSVAVPVVVLTAALLHAVWNGQAHRVGDKLAGFTLISLAYAGFGAVLVWFTPVPGAAAWPYLASSAALQVLYQFLLLRAYQLGDFGQMYPLARGTAPLLVAVVSAAVLGQALPAGEAIGVLVISGGLAGLALADGIPGRDRLPALAAAVGTGVVIAAYTVVDGTGVRHSGTVTGYIAWLFLCQGPVLPLLAWASHGRSLPDRLRPVWWRGLTGGVLSLLAYALVVWAQAHGSLPAVAALRETSILIAALLGTLVFRERFGARRMAASATVLAGITVLELTHG